MVRCMYVYTYGTLTTLRLALQKVLCVHVCVMRDVHVYGNLTTLSFAHQITLYARVHASVYVHVSVCVHVFCNIVTEE